MATIFGNIGDFDENVEQWSAYTERFDYFVLVNAVANDKVVPTFLSIMGAKTFNLLRSLVQPVKPGTKTYKQLVEILGAHFSWKLLVIAERFRFHNGIKRRGKQ